MKTGNSRLSPANLNQTFSHTELKFAIGSLTNDKCFSPPLHTSQLMHNAPLLGFIQYVC